MTVKVSVVHKREVVLKDTKEIQYNNVGNEIETTLVYPCGCQFVITWFSIQNGRLKRIMNEELCEKHDPTIPFVENQDN